MRKVITCAECRTEFAYEHQAGPTRQRCDGCKASRKRRVDAAKTARWRAANPDRQRAYGREYQARRREDPAYRQINSDRELMRKYGIDRAEFNRRAAEQGGLCAICGGSPRGPGSVLHVDHCHDSARVRGLLCGPCNTAIGLLNDDPERAEALARYLREDC